MKTREEMIKAIVKYFEENPYDFEDVIEQADSYDGYLGDNRYYNMADLDDLYNGVEPSEVLTRAFYGYDTDSHGEKEYGAFNPNRDYFSYNGYGNLVSTDYKDYSDYNDEYFAEKILDREYGSYVDYPDELEELITDYEDELEELED